MTKFLYSCCQSIKSLLVDRQKFYFTALEFGIAVVLCNVLLGSILSLQLLKVQLQTDISNSLLITPSYFRLTDEERMKMYKGTYERPVSVTKEDVEEIQGFFGKRADPYYIVHWSISVKKENSDFQNILVFFTNALSQGECFVSESARKFIDDNEFKVFSGFSKEELASSVLENLREKMYREVKLNEMIVEAHLVTNKINTATNDVVVLLPINLYFEHMENIKIDSELLAIYFKRDFDSDGVFKTIQLLNERHGDAILYSYGTAHQDIRRMVRDLEVSIFTLAMIACGVFLILTLGMGGLVASLIKKREKEIGIQLCLGVSIYFLYFESLLKILLPAISAGLIGLALSIPLLKTLELAVVKTHWIWLSSIGSFSVVCMIAALASLLPLMELSKIQPIQALRR